MGTPLFGSLGVVGGVIYLYTNQIYVVKPEFHVDAPQVSDYNEYKDKVANNLKSRTEYAIITALREMAEIRDYRYKY